MAMTWSWLVRWLRKPAAPARIVLYTRAGCHLCDDAWTVLEAARHKYSLVLTQVDVDGDPALVARFGLEVPVVVVDGRVRFRGRVNVVLLDRLLRQRKRGEPGASAPGS